MSTFKEKLVSGLKTVGKLPQKIASWSQKTQIIVAASTAGTLMVASVGGVAIYQHGNSEETIVEEETDTQVQVVENDTQETLTSTEIVDIPDYVSCVISSNSIEKDLTIYIKGSDNKKIEGEPFEVKLIDPDDADLLEDALAAIDDINEQLADLETEEDDGDSDVKIDSTTGNGTLTLNSADGEESTEAESAAGENTIYLSSLTGEEMTEKDELLLEKEEAIAAYAEALTSLKGDTYKDSDSDGMIYIQSITDGDYVACLIPADNYDADSYAVEVNVKEKIEYKAVENIEDKIVSEAAAGDVEETHDEIVVEAVASNTVEFVESKTETLPGLFIEAKAAALKASASSEVNTATAEKKGGSEAGGDNTQSTETESGTTTETQTQTQAQTETETKTETETETETETDTTDGAEITGSIQGRIYLAAVTGNTSGDQTSKLSVTESATVYSDVSGANMIAIVVTAANVSNVTVKSDNSKLTVSGSGSSYTLTAAGATSDASAMVTVSGTDINEETISVTCAVTIKGSMNQLVDEAGNVLYMDNLGEALAYYKNYSASTTYYYQSDEPNVVYYGWQTIDGTRYYFDKNGEKVTGTQTISGITYSFGSDGALLTSGYGIDVSKWQGTIDWKQASTAVSFAIIRAGYRGSSGGLAIDSYAGTNIKNATANGVKVGLYFYSRAVNEVQAVEEASLAISIAQQYGGISYPIYIDMEADNQKSLSTAQRDAVVLAFCTTVKNAGYQAGVYANKNWLTNYLTPSSYTGYSIWCAQYNTSCTYGGRYDIWQYSSKGSIPGIKGNVDLDKSYF